ncbi:hypothetical protein Pam4_29 [Pseudanabaena phage Pam4]|nr:hypothetical protein Pam4_29 [Pseudanabaena phage Pam4]
MTDDVLAIPGAPEPRDRTNDHLTLRLGDHPEVLHAHRPPLAVLLDLITAMDASDPMAQAAAFNGLLDEVLAEESVAHVRERFADRDDDLDLDSPEVENLFKVLVGLWYEGPTRKPSASSPSSGPRSGGRPSTGRRR